MCLHAKGRELDFAEVRPATGAVLTLDGLIHVP